MDNPHPRRWRPVATVALTGACAGVIVLAAAGAATPAVTPFEAAADTRIRSFVHAREFQGSVLIARHDSVVFERTYAFADRRVVPTPRYGIGSITKTFTAAAVERLEQRGALRLDDRLSRFVPGFPKGDSITIEQLLGHTAGIPDYYTDAEYPQERGQPMTPRTFADWLATKPLDFPPGSQSRYSSSGYALLAYVIERASGEPYDTFVRRELLDSLGLGDTGPLTRRPPVSGLAPGRDPGPLPDGTMAPVEFDWSWLVGSGSLYSTPRDLLRWTHAVLRDGFVDRRARTYPYGWALRERHHQHVIEQTGRIPAGYSAKISYLPGADLTVIVLANLQTEAINRLADDLESLALGEPPAPVPARRSIRLVESQVDSLAGRYEMFPGFVLEVRAQRGGAWLAGPDGDFMPLDATGPDHFYFRLLDVPVAFARDSTSGSPRLIWNGQFRARRLP